ncbi:cell division protein FtsQ/DivIB [Iningainema tapete]|uniref:FtsQ-type POTRA domain-containing protein n=1 Tax=Iningainema tapete BLCC-T55 TaxID=2748662 RepID=A0A8J6XUG4_9CYAN|nr:FtsQ-type POTRA domain-containing protein [Iningainema tapete]MBD2778729.1 FtsQ-type POTRA domain-containing protein [Iningainema tapete BLCC-T55]
MAGILSVSRTHLQERRKRLRLKRILKIAQAIWRTIAIFGLLSGLLWIALQPFWVLRTEQDIEISGNQLLSSSTIQSLLLLQYPQSLWRIEPKRLAKSLQQQPTIEQARVTRRLFPPGLIVQVKERVPVAIAQNRTERQDGKINNKKLLGLLDKNGVWMPISKYISLNTSVKLPDIKIIGTPEQYRPYWVQLYQVINQSAVKVMEIDYQDPTNLILKTELGVVHLGPISSHLSEQIKVMAMLRDLPQQVNPSQIEYIDLRNPAAPLVQMNQKKPTVKPQTRGNV